MVYIAGLAAIYCSLGLSWLIRYRGALLAIIALLVVGCIAVFRGDVGTDTASYEQMVADYRSSSLDGREPGFAILVLALAALTQSDPAVIRLVAVVLVGLLVAFAARADRDEMFLLLGYILPAFFFQYSMNVLRFGLASSVLLVAVQEARRSRTSVATVLGLSAVAFHYSSLVSFLVVTLASRQWTRLSSLLLAVLGATVVVGVFAIRSEYFAEKILWYNVFAAPEEHSGFSKVAVISVLLLGVFASSLPFVERLKLMLLGGGLGLSFWWVATLSYAGLRLLDLLAFSFPLSILAIYGRLEMALDAKMKVALLLAGGVAAAAMLRGFWLSEGAGSTPFLPYELIF